MAVNRGDIYHSSGFPFIDHGKFFVVIGQNEEEVIGAFFINSNIRNFLLTKPKLLALQLGLGSDNYPFLNYNSFLDCSQIIRVAKAVLDSDIAAGIASFRGKLHPEDLDSVLSLVRDSDVFSDSEKEFFK